MPQTTPTRSLFVTNFTPVPRYDYRVGVPNAGFWEELLNTDAAVYGGSNLGNLGGVESEAAPWHGREQSVRLTLPPLAVVALRLRQTTRFPAARDGAKGVQHGDVARD